MGKSFETHHNADLPTTPEQIWDAIATGPGISSWFIGRTEIHDTTVRTHFGDDWIPTGTITTHQAPTHFAYRTTTAPDGRFIAYEYLIEARDHSATHLRTVTSGFLPGDDWEDEYEAMQHGTALFFATLVEYLTHFPGRTATPVTAFGPPVTDWPTTWQNLRQALPDGHIYHENPHALALRTNRGLYRYLRGFHGSLVADHELFAPDNTDWNTFLRAL